MTRGSSRTDRVRQLRRTAARRRAAARTPLAARQAPPAPSPEAGNRWAARISHVATSLTAVAAVAALLFTGISSLQAQDELANRRRELDIAAEGQVTERFTAAVAQLGDTSPDVRLGGIYALERMMRDSPKDQRSIVGVLSAYIRTHCAKAKPHARAPEDTVTVTAAATAVAVRPPGHDDEELVNWSRCLLTDATMEDAYLSASDLSDTTLSHVSLNGGDLSYTDLSGASLDDVGLSGANLSQASLIGVDLTKSQSDVDPGEVAYFWDTNFSLCDLTRTNFSRLGFRHVDFSEADLTNANLSHTEVFHGSQKPFVGRTSFAGATLANTNLDGADLRSAVGLTRDQLLTAYYTSTTKLPPHLANRTDIKRLVSTRPWEPSISA
ncbi:MAG TPA: pentapeptide repeat-containing protein [Mycobacterium sp.]